MKPKKIVTIFRNKIVHGLLLWLIVAVLLIIAYVLTSREFLDQLWLSRAGCLIVVLGILSGVSGMLEERLLHRVLKLKRRIAERRARLAFGGNEEQLGKEMENIRQRYDDHRLKMREDVNISVGLIEASLVITGTLLWGFGDLVRYV